MNDKEKHQAVAKRLRDARLEVDLTQKEVAKKLGQPQSYVSRVESSGRRLDVVELLDFAFIYQKDLEYFVQDFKVDI